MDSTRRGPVSFAEVRPGGPRVLLELGHEGIGPVKFHHVPEPGFEMDRQDGAIQVRSIIEEVNLHGGGLVSFVERGAGPDVGHALPVAALPLDMDRIDAGARGELMFPDWDEVGGPKAEGAAAGIAVDDATGPGLGSAQQDAGTIAVACGAPLADLGAGDGQFILDVGRNVDHVESVGLAAVPQQVDVALSSGTEPVVVADHDGCAPKALHEHIAHEVRGLEPGEIPVEGLDDKVVEARAGELRNALGQGREQLQTAVVSEQDLTGVGGEGEDDGLRAF